MFKTVKLQDLGIYHTIGALRTKPGRGDPMSCSDKMMRWNVLGCQGALLAHFIVHQVYFQSMTICGPLFDAIAVHRALLGRIESLVTTNRELLKRNYCIHHPEIVYVSEPPAASTLKETLEEVTLRDDNKKLAPVGKSR